MDWKLFTGKEDGNGVPNDNLEMLPAPPPWRFGGRTASLVRPAGLDLKAERIRAKPFLPTDPMVLAVNSALYLRRPLLLTGKPGTGKSTLISKVAYELKLGPVIRWPITSRSSVRAGIYEYDAVGRLQASKKKDPPVQEYLRLGPLGTALASNTWPRPLLIDEIDKSDLDFANDLLNVIEEGIYEIPELMRLRQQSVTIRDYFGNKIRVSGGLIRCEQFPFVVMTSNAERDFPAPLLRRCIRLNIELPTSADLVKIVNSHLALYAAGAGQSPEKFVEIIAEFERKQQTNQDLATDQLLNAVFLTMTLSDGRKRSYDKDELNKVRESLLRSLSGPSA